MSMYADSNYSFNPWMRDVDPQLDPRNRPGEVLRAEQVIEEISNTAPMPAPAGIQPRFGAMKTAITVADVLKVPSTTNLREADTGQQGYGGPALGAW